MSELFSIPENEDIYSWLEVVPKYQREMLNELLEHYTPGEAASIWLDSSIENNSPFSSNGPKKKYSKYVIDEIHKMLCGDQKYTHEREEITSIINNNGSKTAIISCISATIGAQLGLSATFLAPAIVLIIATIGKLTLNAWCEMHSDEVVDEQSNN